MADYNEQVNRLWDEWIEETRQTSGDAGEFVEWALAGRRLAPRPQDIKHILRKQVTQALRQAKRYDEDGGFTYRAKQCVTLLEGGVALKHYFDTDTGGTSTLRQKSVHQRREAVAHDVYRAVCDVERMNKMFPKDPQLSFFLEFSDDVEELRAAERLDRDDESDAA
ncbi:hypothetical protein MMA231_02537 [Asticcacaulis sp. MM231]|uniref:hypothetical protein n=1 Tax=Asticcacaulis sp. MM231 TaxID=3157666 RepID=UPI0032D5AAE2